eukprot:TRINITY_DN34985_c0_g1_i1.p1 TRINITY_DN34985_c0_g1~~TRINITY_DN34985_c0_g1_i1.p1  ORF type:complete len:322 (+),score=97.81 TRINITY_DN34985_c0_g1_i1:60-1025(+)
MEVKRYLIFIVIFRIVAFLFKSWVQGGRCISKARLDGKVAVITGANTGIGKETARELVKRGAEVHVLCRDTEKAEEMKKDIKNDTGREVFVHKMDLASLVSVRECVAELSKCLEKIDILINNAGVATCPEWKTEEGFELQFGTNHVGHFLLTTELLPLLRKAGKSRVVVVSSKAHKFGKMHFDDLNCRTRPYETFGAYSQSKLANVLFAKELARQETELESGVSVYCLHPGTVKTEVARHVKESSGFLVYSLMRIVLPLLSKTPQNGAQTSIYCAVEETLENETGKYYEDCKEAKPSKEANNMDDAKNLWKVTMDMVKKNE